MYKRFRRIATTLLVLATIAAPGMGLADTLKMKNGDVITGTVKKIEDGKLFIEPAYGDEFSVDLAEVASVDAEQVFEIELESGEEVDASLGLDASGSQVLMVDGQPREVELVDLAAAQEPEDWYERTSHADVNMTWNGGNTDSRNNLIFLDTALKLGDHRHLGELTIRRDETDGVRTKEQDLFQYTYNYLFNDPWYLGALATFERDPIKELDHRYTVGATVGRDIFNDSNTFLTISLGAGYSEEQLAGVTESGATGLWGLRYEQDLRDGDMTLFHNHTVNYNFYADNNAIFKSNTGLRFDIIDDVYASISLRYDYETEPAEGSENEDTTLAIGIGAKF